MNRILPIVVLFAWTGSSMARPGTSDAATSVLGQADLDSETASNPPTSRSLDSVDGVAIDPTTGKLFVSDQSNHRILRFSSAAAYVTHAEAEAVFGQPNFNTRLPNGADGIPDAGSFDTPSGLCCDAQGTLWVADNGNARVLRFDNASAKPSGTALADGVIGQPGFTLNTPPVNSDSDWGIQNPAGVTVDAQGNLWVSDASNPRVLRFDNAASLGMVFDGVASGYLGKVDMGQFAFVSSPDGFGSGAGGMSIDAAGRLWVSDPTNNRVLRFDNAANKANGASADGVLGQENLNSSAYTAPPAADTMSNPYYVTAAPDGTVWVSDFSNNRVLGFPVAAGKPNGADAEIVLGQPDFVSGAAAANSARTIKSPSQVAIGREGSLFIGQLTQEGLVKRWSDPVTIVAPKSGRASRMGVATLRGTATGAVQVEFQVPAQGGFKRARGSATAWTVRLTKLKRKTTLVSMRAVAFDGRSASAKVRVIKPR